MQSQVGISYTYWGMRSLCERLQIGKKVPRPQAENASSEAQAAWKKGASAPR